MAVKHTVRCSWHAPLYPDRPLRGCPFCGGKGTVEQTLFVDAQDITTPASERISNEVELGIEIECPCGAIIQLWGGGDGEVCECGRAYRVEAAAFCNDEHVGDIDYWLKLDEAKEAAKWAKITEEVEKEKANKK